MKEYGPVPFGKVPMVSSTWYSQTPGLLAFWSYDRGPFALFADNNEPLNYIIKAILLMINPICVYKPRIHI